MLGSIFDLLPDEVGEILGFGLISGVTYLYVDHLNGKLSQEKNKSNELNERLTELSRKMDQTCLSPEAIKYLQEEIKE